MSCGSFDIQDSVLIGFGRRKFSFSFEGPQSILLESNGDTYRVTYEHYSSRILLITFELNVELTSYNYCLVIVFYEGLGAIDIYFTNDSFVKSFNIKPNWFRKGTENTELGKFILRSCYDQCWEPRRTYRCIFRCTDSYEEHKFEVRSMVSGRIDAVTDCLFLRDLLVRLEFSSVSTVVCFLHCEDKIYDNGGSVVFPDGKLFTFDSFSERSDSGCNFCKRNQYCLHVQNGVCFMYVLLSFEYGTYEELDGLYLSLYNRIMSYYFLYRKTGSDDSFLVNLYSFCKSGKDRSPRAYLLFMMLFGFDKDDVMNLRYEKSHMPRKPFRQMSLYQKLFDKYKSTMLSPFDTEWIVKG